MQQSKTVCTLPSIRNSSVHSILSDSPAPNPFYITQTLHLSHFSNNNKKHKQTEQSEDSIHNYHNSSRNKYHKHYASNNVNSNSSKDKSVMEGEESGRVERVPIWKRSPQRQCLTLADLREMEKQIMEADNHKQANDSMFLELEEKVKHAPKQQSLSASQLKTLSKKIMYNALRQSDILQATDKLVQDDKKKSKQIEARFLQMQKSLQKIKDDKDRETKLTKQTLLHTSQQHKALVECRETLQQRRKVLNDLKFEVSKISKTEACLEEYRSFLHSMVPDVVRIAHRKRNISDKDNSFLTRLEESFADNNSDKLVFFETPENLIQIFEALQENTLFQLRSKRDLQQQYYTIRKASEAKTERLNREKKQLEETAEVLRNRVKQVEKDVKAIKNVFGSNISNNNNSNTSKAKQAKPIKDNNKESITNADFDLFEKILGDEIRSSAKSTNHEKSVHGLGILDALKAMESIIDDRLSTMQDMQYDDSSLYQTVEDRVIQSVREAKKDAFLQRSSPGPASKEASANLQLNLSTRNQSKNRSPGGKKKPVRHIMEKYRIVRKEKTKVYKQPTQQEVDLFKYFR